MTATAPPRPAGPAAPSTGRTDVAEPGEPTTIPSPHAVKKEVNPFTESDWRMWFYAWSGFMLRLMLIFGAIFSVVQYLGAREEKRVERTLALVELGERDIYQNAQRAMRTRLVALVERFQSEMKPDATDAEKAVYSDRIGKLAMTPEGGDMPLAEFQEHFDRVLYLLNRVGSCVNTNLCSPLVANDYFHDYAETFWAYFGGHIEARRLAGSPTLAEPLGSWLEANRPAPPLAPAN